MNEHLPEQYIESIEVGIKNIFSFIINGKENEVKELDPFEEDVCTQNPGVFFDELILFVKSANDLKTKEVLITTLYERYFQLSPNLFNNLSVSDQIVYCALLNSYEEIQGYMGQSAVGETVCSLSFCGEETLRLVHKKIVSLPMDEQFNVITQMRTLFANAVAQGSWAKQGVIFVEKILEGISKDNLPALISYCVQNVTEDVAGEFSDPSLSVVTYPGNHRAGRLGKNFTDKEKERSLSLEAVIIPSFDHNIKIKDPLYINIAKDVIGVFNSSYILKGYLKINELPENLKQTKYPLKTVKNVYNGLAEKGLEQYDIEGLVRFMEILIKDNNEPAEDMAHLMGISLDRLHEFYAVRDFVSSEKNKIEEQIESFDHEAISKNQEASDIFINKVLETINNIFKDLGKPAKFISDEINSILIYIEDKNDRNFEYAFNAAFNLASISKDLEHPLASSLKSLSEDLKKTHGESFELSKNKKESLYNSIPQATLDAGREFNEIIIGLTTNNLFQDRLIDYLGKNIKEFEEGEVLVKIKDINAVPVDQNLNPTGAITDSRALAFLYEPRMRAKIQEDLGILLTDIPFRYHIHFFNLLVSKDKSAYDKVKKLMDDNIGFEQDVFVAYLATATRRQSEETIFGLSESLPKDVFANIISLYSKIVRTTDDLQSSLEETYKNGFSIKDTSGVTNEVIERANQILDTANSLELGELVRKLSRIESDQVLFTSSFKHMKRANLEVSLEDIKSSSFEYLPGVNISEEQKQKMREIYKANHEGSIENEERLLAEFESKFTDSKSKFYIFSWKEAVQSFVAFTPNEQGQLYGSAFNVAPEARGYKIGEAMLEEAIDKEARENILAADCYAKALISAKYIETGWVGIKSYQDNGDTVLDIMRDESLNGAYFAKDKSTAELLSVELPQGVELRTAATQSELPFDLLNQGYTLTRIFKNEAGESVGIFEKIKE